ncbi:MAG TPA: hypothetical protein VIJ40_07560 [Acidimicrobiales bacterium]
MSITEEDFELELRSLPGVLNVGMSHGESGEVELVKLVILGESPGPIRTQATQIANLYFPDVTIELEVADAAQLTNQVASRVALLSAEFDEVSGVCEVRLGYEGRIGVGRAESGRLIGAVEGTLAALRELAFEISFHLEAVTTVPTVRGLPIVVTLRSFSDDVDLYGIAQSEGESLSAARATLNALNRFLSGPKNAD